MWRGRFQLGQEVFLSVLTTDANGTPTVPDAAPMMKIWSNVATKVVAKLIPVIDRFGATGMFGMNVFLDGTFSTGLLRVTYQWNISTYIGADEDGFEIVAGGNADGQIVSLAWLHQPASDFVVYQMTSGRIKRQRNPKI